jgi:hypothetical protein
MLSILRFFAVCTMLLALLMGLITLFDVFDVITRDHQSFGRSDSQSTRNGGASSDHDSSTPTKKEPGVWEKLALADRIDHTANLLRAPAALFCTGGALYVLIRIARSQE